MSASDRHDSHRNLPFLRVNSQSQLEHLCDQLSKATEIAIDTEFVSEDCFLPDLCLIQVATSDLLAVIDTHAVDDYAPFWQLMADGNHETIVHAGREELRFCLRHAGKPLARLLDVQLAAGFIGMEYPAAYGTLISKLLGKSLRKHDTRTDWRRRPLTDSQIEYALQDVVYLISLSDLLKQRLRDLEREAWFATEIQQWQTDIKTAATRERWRRVSGASGLSSRSLAIVRELWRWRQQEAERRNQPVRRVLRDDLIVELARRATADINRIREVRGLDRGDLKRHYKALAAAVQRALAIPKHELPTPAARNNGPQFNLLSQFLFTAMGCMCRTATIAPSIVGTSQDIRDWVAYHLELGDSSQREKPSLASGWRGELVEPTFQAIVRGELAIRVDDPMADEPLRLDPLARSDD